MEARRDAARGGGPALLSSYAAERGSVTQRICAANKAMWLAGSTAVGPPAVDLRTLDMGYRYVCDLVLGSAGQPVLEPDAAYVQGADPGVRAPHAWLDDRRARSTIDAFGNGFVLVSGEHTAWLQEVARCQQDLAIPVSSLTTSRAEVLTAYALLRGGAVLVRPDGHVAWRTDAQPDPGTALRSALTTAVGHTTRDADGAVAQRKR